MGCIENSIRRLVFIKLESSVFLGILFGGAFVLLELDLYTYSSMALGLLSRFGGKSTRNGNQ